MSIQYTYDTLRDDLQSYAEDSDTEFVAEIPTFIAKAETRVLRDLNLEIFEDWTGVLISAGDRLVDKPTDAIAVNALFYRDPSTQEWIDVPRRSFQYCVLYSPNENTEAAPAHFASYDEDQIYVVPTPDQTYSTTNAKALVTIRPSGLGSSNQTTWLSEHVGDLLFCACMIEVYDYLKHPDKLEEQANKYQSLVPGLILEFESLIRPAYKDLNNRRKGADG